MTNKVTNLNPKETNNDKCLKAFQERIKEDQDIVGIICIAETSDGNFVIANSAVGYHMIGALEKMKLGILDALSENEQED